MLRTAVCGLLLALGLSSMGCAGGGFVIGPVSSYTATQHDRVRLQRATYMSNLPAEKKEAVVRLSAYTSDPRAVGGALSVDVSQLVTGDYTWGEVVTQFFGSLTDAGLYTGLAYGIKKGVEKLQDSGGSDPGGTGSNNTLIYIYAGRDVTLNLNKAVK